jgi:acyl-CoA thioesterase
MMDRGTLVKMGADSPYFKHLDMALADAGEGWAQVKMEVKPHHMNLHGLVHGGAISSLADQAAMRAVQTLLPKGQAASTVQMDVHFLAPARGKVLMSEGKVRKVGRKTAFADAEVFNEDGAIAAVARCTIMLAEKAR